jgi:hypothetical protein
MHELDSGNRRCGSPKLLEAKHRPEPQFDGTVILFDEIIQIF